MEQVGRGSTAPRDAAEPIAHLAKGASPRSIPLCRDCGNVRLIPPDTLDEDLPPSTRIIRKARMSAPAQPAIIGPDELPGMDSSAVIRLPAAADEERPKRRSSSGSQKRKRQHVKRCRFDDDELAAFEARARASGLEDGAFIRAATLGAEGPRARRRLPVDREALAHAVAEFNRAGSNLNQAVRALNEIAAAGRGGESRDLLAVLVAELELPIRTVKAEFAAPLAAILAALGYEAGA